MEKLMKSVVFGIVMLFQFSAMADSTAETCKIRPTTVILNSGDAINVIQVSLQNLDLGKTFTTDAPISGDLPVSAKTDEGADLKYDEISRASQYRIESRITKACPKFEVVDAKYRKEFSQIAEARKTSKPSNLKFSIPVCHYKATKDEESINMTGIAKYLVFSHSESRAREIATAECQRMARDKISEGYQPQDCSEKVSCEQYTVDGDNVDVPVSFTHATYFQPPFLHI
jgi:hypothetical protein